MGKKTSCEIILGSYEEFVLGFKYNTKAEEAEQTFAVHSHVGSIRCLAQSGDLLASGGADDRIVVYNLKTRKEHCMLTHHNGTVNCLEFTKGHTHLMSGGQDGMLTIVRVGNWQLEKVFESAHKGAAVLDIAIHSSGKLALSLGGDSTLRTWNLIKGRQAYVINLNTKSKEPKCLHSIKWGPDGEKFVLVGNKYTDVWSITTGGVLKSIVHERKVSSCIWHSDETLIVGYDDGYFAFVDIETEDVDEHQAHASRVKCMSLLDNKLVTASSTGEVKVWKVLIESRTFKQIIVANAGCRFTCMCVVPDEIGDAESSTVSVTESDIDLNDTIDDDDDNDDDDDEQKEVEDEIEEVVDRPSKRKKKEKKIVKKKVKRARIQEDEVITIKEPVVVTSKSIVKKGKFKN